MAHADASTKLRMVLDYVPCEACLAHPVADQDLLCTICARVDRQVAIRVATRTQVLVERPSPPEAPIVIPPAPAPEAPEAPPAAPAPAPPRELRPRLAEEPAAAPGTIEILLDPLPPLAPLALAPLAPPPPQTAPAPPEAAAAPVEEEPEFDVDDLVTVTSAREEFFDYRGTPPPAARAPPPAPREEPAPAPVETKPEPEAPEIAVEDDFVFRPPAAEPAPEPEPEPSREPELPPTEEVRVVPEQEAWAPPAQEWAPSPDLIPEPEEEIVEMDVVPEEPAPAPFAEPPAQEEPIHEMEIVEMEVVDEPEPVEALAPPAPSEPEPLAAEEEILDLEIVEMEVVDEEPPAPLTASRDLHRLRGMDADAESALLRARIAEVAHLSGHDAGELADRTGLPFERVLAWVQTADLVAEVGIPFDAAAALVAAGVQGPRGLAEADPEELADRVSAFGGVQLTAREIRRWKRRT